MNDRRNSEAIQEELCRELVRLRSLVREVGENFMLSREGDIETIICHLDDVPPAMLRTEVPWSVKEIQKLKLKPAKGRLKDMKSIDELIENLALRVITAHEGRRGNKKGR